MGARRSAWWCLIFSLVGIGLCGYLFFLYLGLLRGELLGGAACGGGGLFNCHIVTTSAWGSVLGIPLALWGVIGYVAAAALALLAQQSEEWAQPAFVALFALSLLSVLVDMALLALMLFVIQSLCLVCLLTYAVNLLLLWVSERAVGVPSWRALGQLPSTIRALLPSPRRPATALFWGVMLLGITAGGALHAATIFVSRGTLGSLRHQLREFIAKQARVSPDIAGDPALGRAGSPLQIVEFSDFFCPACRRAAQLNAIVLAHHRQDAQFVFKHFPLDTSCNTAINRQAHPGACTVAAATECAHQQGKFWAFHDLIFQETGAYPVARLEQDATRLGLDAPRFTACMSSGQGMEAVRRDIAEGTRLGVGSTPTYFVNGVRMVGGIHPATFEDLVAVLRGRSTEAR